MNQETPTAETRKRRPPRGLGFIVMLGIVVCAGIAVAYKQGNPPPTPAQLANDKQAQQMRDIINKISSNGDKPALDSVRFLNLVREATDNYQHDNMTSVEAGKEAIAMLDASKDAAHGTLFRAEISLVIVRSAKSAGDKDDQTKYAQIAEESFNHVIDDPMEKPATKAQAKADLAQLKAVGP